jgi:hypothetical protein
MMDPIKAFDISHSKEKRACLFSDGADGKDDLLVSTYQNRILADLSRCGIEVEPAFIILLLTSRNNQFAMLIKGQLHLIPIRIRNSLQDSVPSRSRKRLFPRS